MHTTFNLKALREIISFSLPISAGLLINMLSNALAMILIGKLGKQELAAGALAIPSFMMILTTGASIFYAIGILTSHQKDSTNSIEYIGNLIKNGIWLATLLALPLVFILWHMDTLLYLFKQDKDLIKIATGYFHCISLSIIPTLIGVVISQFFIGIGKPRIMLITSSLNLPINFFLCYLLILGKMGFPQLGVAGLGCSITIAQTLVWISVIGYIYLNKEMKKYFLTLSWLPDLSSCKRILILGYPIGIQFGAELAAITCATYFMGQFGANALAASQIISQYTMLTLMLIFGLSQGNSFLVSRAYGKQDISLIKNYIQCSFLILAIMFAVLLALFMFSPITLINVFIDINKSENFELLNLAIPLFIISGFMLFFDSIRNVLSGILRGLQDSSSPMHISTFCLWIISIPSSYAVAFIYKGGPIGLRIAFTSGFLLAAIWLLIKLKKRLRQISNDQVAVNNISIVSA